MADPAHEVWVPCNCGSIEACRLGSDHPFPYESFGDSTDTLVTQAHAFGDPALYFSGSNPSSDLADLFFSEPGVRQGVTACGTFRVFPQPVTLAFVHPVFGDGIREVVGRCSEKQMIGTYTRPYVAMVTNGQPGWNGAEMQFPRQTVGTDDRSAAASTATANTTVTSASVDCTLPEPAIVCLENARPEAVGDGRTPGMLIGHRSLSLRCQPPAGVNGAGA